MSGIGHPPNEIGTYQGPNGPSGGSPFEKATYPNSVSLQHAIACAINLVWHAAEVPRPHAAVINAPIRAFAIWDAYQHEDYVRATLNAAAFGVLFFRYGWVAAVGVDIIAETRNWWLNSLSSAPDTTYPSNKDGVSLIVFTTAAEARKHLNLPADCENSQKIVEARDIIVNVYKARQAKVPPYFADQFNIAIQNAERACAFLLAAKKDT